METNSPDQRVPQTQLLHTKFTTPGTYPDHKSFAPIARHTMTGDYDDPDLGGSGDGVRSGPGSHAREDRPRLYTSLDFKNIKYLLTILRLWVNG